MEQIDEALARRVWQRVQGHEPSEIDPAALTALMGQELTDAAALLSLGRRLGGRGADAWKLARQCQQHAGCLRGICSLMTGTAPEASVPIPAEEPAQATLRKCYVNFLGRIRAYEARSKDPDFGPVFQQMAQAESALCPILLALAGKV